MLRAHAVMGTIEPSLKLIYALIGNHDVVGVRIKRIGMVCINMPGFNIQTKTIHILLCTAQTEDLAAVVLKSCVYPVV